MSKGRLEAFSDGVFAIIITIMVLELKVPHGADLSDLRPLLPVFFSYVLSFIFVGIYWNNHHHMLQVVKRISGGNLWANLHLLFWLSLVPFVTGWMGENYFASLPVALHGVVLLCAAIAYVILQHSLIRGEGSSSALVSMLGRDLKGYSSLVIYLVSVAVAMRHPHWSCAGYVLVAIIWLVPDPRIERNIARRGAS